MGRRSSHFPLWLALAACGIGIPNALCQETRGVQSVTRSAGTQTPGKTYALLIGISRYEKVHSLEFADKDAELLASFLKSPLGGVDPANILLLENEQATRAGIDDAVNGFVQAHAAPENSLILFVAGHGVYLKTEEDPVTKKVIEKDPYILTHDSNPSDPKTTGYPMDEFRGMIFKQTSRYGRVLVYVDVCHADNVAGIAGGAELDESIRQAFQGGVGDIGLMVASVASKYAFESSLFGGGHGAFSYFLVSGLNGSAAFPGEDTLRWRDLFHYVSDAVYKYTGGFQNPKDKSTNEELIVLPDVRPKGIELPPALPLSKEAQRGSRNRDAYSAPVIEASLSPRGAVDEIGSSIARGALLPEDPGSAYALVTQLPAGSPKRIGAERRLRIALEDQGQEIVSKYLEGDQIPQVRGDFLRCSRVFEEADKLAHGADFDRSRGLFCQGRTLIFDGRYAEAQALLMQSIQLDPKRGYAWNALGISHLEQINRTVAVGAATAEFDQAAAAFQTAMRYAPYWAYPVHNLALTLSERGDFDGAIRQYLFGMQIGPQYSYLPYNLGLLYERLGDNENARKWFEAAGKVAAAYPRKQNGAWPERAQIFNALGTLAMEHHQPARAKTYFNDALADDPANLNARHNLALLNASQKNFAEADRLWSGVIADSPQFLAARVSLAGSLDARGDSAAAIAQYREILRIDPAWSGVHEALAKLYMQTGDNAQALQELDSSLRITPSSPFLLETRGDLLARLGRTSEATADWNSALRTAPDRAVASRIARKLKNAGQR